MNTTPTAPTGTASAATATITIDAHHVARWDLVRAGSTLEFGYATTRSAAHREVLAAASFANLNPVLVDLTVAAGAGPVDARVRASKFPAVRAALLWLAETVSVACTQRREVLAAGVSAPVALVLQAGIVALEAIAAAGVVVDAAAVRAEDGDIDVTAVETHLRTARRLRSMARTVVREMDTVSRDGDAAENVGEWMNAIAHERHDARRITSRYSA